MAQFKAEYGKFTKEQDGRLSGHVLRVSPPRKDGKYPVVHIFGSGKRFNKLHTEAQLQSYIDSIEKN